MKKEKKNIVAENPSQDRIKLSFHSLLLTKKWKIGSVNKILILGAQDIM